MLLRIHHETKLTYSAPICETVFEVRMAPPSDEDQTNLGYRLRISPSAPVTAYRDGFGNRVDLFNILTHYRELIVRTTAIVRTHRRCGRSRLSEVGWGDLGRDSADPMEYIQPSPLVSPCGELDDFLACLPKPSGTLHEVVARLMEGVHDRLKYEKRVTTSRTPVGEALKLGRGVCQDFAHLFLGGCRGLGLPARYVSGYVYGEGELATHAWCQVWAGPFGWVDVDPTRGTIVGDEHVLTAIGRDYSDVPPNRGVWRGLADESIAVSVKVETVDRVPHDWSDWGPQAPWSGVSWTQSQSQSQRQGRRLALGPKAGWRQQQGQQQQG